MKNLDIAIVGAGIGGLTAAIALQRAGFSPKIYEQAPVLGEVGAGLSLSPNAVLGLAWLGIEGFLAKNANEPLTQYTHHGETGEDLVVIDRRNCREQYGAAYYQIHRADFHEELVRKVNAHDPSAIQLSKSLVSVEQEGDDPVAVFEDGTRVRADVLIGADGVRSVVRDQVFGGDEVEFTGHMAWRALIPASDLPPFFVERSTHVWVGGGRNCVTYPIRGTKLVNFIAFARAESWVEESWSAPAKPGEIAKMFDGWCEPAVQATQAITIEDCFQWGLFARKPLPSLIKGSVALIGDAGHPMLPFFGQGASSAIEDAVVLARCFDASATPDEALDRFNQARIERATLIQSESNLGGDRLQSLDPYSLKNKPVKNEDALGIFNYDPVTVAV